MSKRSKEAEPSEKPIPQPVDVVDGIPDRSARPAAWKRVAIAIVFLAWMAFLVYCLLAGNVGG